MKYKILKTTAILLLIINTAFAQQPVISSPEMMAANKLVQEKKWSEAEKAFAEIVKKEPNNGRAWFFLGFARHSQEKFESAIEAFQKNFEISKNSTSTYNIAAGYSRLKQTDKAFEYLEQALKNGAAATTNIASDSDFDNIKNDARFKKMQDIADRAKRPCMYSDEARQFDFWVGDWDVFNLANQKAGTNSIQLFANGCGVMENWTSTIGGDGKSINYYDASTKKWYQHWIGSGGGALRYEGTFSDNAMRFEGFTIGQDGKKTLQKLTFFKLDENTVRQLAETSTNEGKTWTVSYDFKYVRMKK